MTTMADLQQQVTELKDQIAALTVNQPVEHKAEGWAPCPVCGSTLADVYEDGSAGCDACHAPLTRAEENKAAGDPLWGLVEAKIGQMSGAADLEQLAQAHADLTEMLQAYGIIPQPAEVKADDDVDETAELLARRQSLEP